MQLTAWFLGLNFSSLFSRIWGGDKEIRVLILGLDGAGKTTILYKLQIGEVVQTIPSEYGLGLAEIWHVGLQHDVWQTANIHPFAAIGFNVETLNYKNLKFNVWDLGGQTSIRPYWRCYYANTMAVIFVVDSTDKERIETASQELHTMLGEEELQDAALLVFANKQDQKDALSASEVSKALKLVDLKDRSWSIVACSAVRGDGLTEGLDWLTNVIKEEHL